MWIRTTPLDAALDHPTSVRFAIEVEEEEIEDQEPFLPAPIDDERVCKRCYVADTCMLFRKTHPNHVWPEPFSETSLCEGRGKTPRNL